MAISRLSGIKFLELLICAVCIGLCYHVQSTGDFTADFVRYTAYGGFFVIIIGGCAGHLMATPSGQRIDLFYCLIGCALFVAAGALIIKDYENRTFVSKETRNYALAEGSMAIINGVLFLVDALFTWRA